MFWRLPCVNDWKELQSYLVNNYEEINYFNIGTVLRSCRQQGSRLGGECDTRQDPSWTSGRNFYGTDDFGFSALPGGYRGSSKTFSLMGSAGYWWTYDVTTPTHAIAYSLANENLQFGIGEKSGSISVRCIIDDEPKSQTSVKAYEIDTIAYLEWAKELKSINRKTEAGLNLPHFLTYGFGNTALSIGVVIFVAGGPTVAGLASVATGLSAFYAGIKILNHRVENRKNHYIRLEEDSWIKEVHK